MKRCPVCNLTFEEPWLMFCTQDGTALIEEAGASSEPPPTIMASSMPPSAGPSERPLDYPGSYNAPPVQARPPQPMTPSWQPPPPPAYAVASSQQQGLAITSLILGIFTMTIGWCCYLGVITGPVAIGMGIYQLIQIKNDPDKFGGKPLAIVGIATGAAYFVLLVFVILLYGLAFLVQGVN